MERFTKTFPLILLLLLLFIGAYLLYFFLFQGKEEKLASLTQEIKQKGDMVLQLNRLVKEKVESQPKQDDLEKEMTALPIWDNTEQLILEFKKSEGKTGVSLTNVQFQNSDLNRLNEYGGSPTPLFPNVKEVQVNMMVTGTYTSIHAFLEEIEKSPRFMIINSVNFGTAATGGENLLQGTKLTASIQLSAYYDPSNRDLVSPKWREYPLP
ncbi:type 4a pilus biogenesis protein PilO [Thermicanus aegyptius]|uniref:type 4a pilus biogenesis protein PilO n=1 Tax=Thermicanus aegyptius TaxID=94009 RepID=UPI0004172401|nr:type 4a pilus biogenesis protein PilO [Thermicanus aegyptius]